jgi:hypothetical protein
MARTDVRVVTLQGRYGEFVDELGGPEESVGDWQLACYVPTYSSQMLGSSGTARVRGTPDLELRTEFRGSDRFQGELLLGDETEHVTLELAPTLMHVNQVEPRAAWDRIGQYLGLR